MFVKFFCNFFVFFTMVNFAFAKTDPCAQLAELQNEDLNFVGFGVGASQIEAEQNAQIDLAKNIRQKIAATSVVQETAEAVTLQTTLKSVVSEILVGAKVLKRCSNQNDYSAIVTLNKKDFLNSLSQKISLNIERAAYLRKKIETLQDQEALASQIDIAKKFLSQYKETTESDLELCFVYHGCKKLKIDHIFENLEQIIESKSSLIQYVFISKDDAISQFFKEEMIHLLEAEHMITTMENSQKSPSRRRITGKCSLKFGTKILPETKDRIVEILCVAEGYAGTQKKFRKSYVCKALVGEEASEENITSACSGRLQAE